MLEYLLCEYNNIKKLDLSNNINLNSIHCGEKALKTLDLSNNKKINFIYGDITLDTGNRYDLSQINWLKTENIAEISFGFYDDEGYSNRDEQSYLSGSIINIIDHDDGIIDITEYNDEKYGSLKAISLYYTTALDAAEVNPGIFVLEADKNHFLAGIATACSDEDKSRLSYSWVAQDESGNFINVSDWDKSEWVEWTPEKFGTYKIFGKVRVDESDELVYTTVALYE